MTTFSNFHESKIFDFFFVLNQKKHWSGLSGAHFQSYNHASDWTEILRFGHQFSFLCQLEFFKILDKCRSVDSAYFCFHRKFLPEPRAIPTQDPRDRSVF